MSEKSYSINAEIARKNLKDVLYCWMVFTSYSKSSSEKKQLLNEGKVILIAMTKIIEKAERTSHEPAKQPD